MEDNRLLQQFESGKELQYVDSWPCESTACGDRRIAEPNNIFDRFYADKQDSLVC